MDYNFDMNEAPAQAVLSIRKRISVRNLPQELGQAYTAIFEYLKEIGAEAMVLAPFAGYYNMDMEDLDVEMGFTIAGPLPGKGDVKANEIPAGKQVDYLFKGPYSGMEPVYNALNQWMNEKGYVPTGTCYEFYFNSPLEVPESELLTKIMFPLK